LPTLSALILIAFTWSQGWNNPGLKLANAFGVFKLNQYDEILALSDEILALSDEILALSDEILALGEIDGILRASVPDSTPR